MNVERGLRAAAWLIALWSFTVLIATAQVAWAPVAICYAAFVIAVPTQHFLARMGDRIWTAMNVVAAIGGAFFAYRDLGNSLVFLTVFLQIQKLVRYKHPRDYLWLFVVSFFQVVLAAAITVDLSFFVTLTLFILLAVTGMVLLTLERIRFWTMADASVAGSLGDPLDLNFGGEANGAHSNGAGAVKAHEPEPPSPVHRVRSGMLPAHYVLKVVLLCIVAALAASCLFMVIPRLAVRKVFMRLRPFDPPAVAGFADQVMVGNLGEIRKDRTIVMRAWVDSRGGGGWTPDGFLRLRGLALDFFDGMKWYPSRAALSRHSGIDGLNPRLNFPFDYDSSHSLRLTIEQDPNQVKWLFGTPFVRRMHDFSKDLQIDYMRDLHAFRISQSLVDTITYKAVSYEEAPMSDVASRPRVAPARDWIMSDEERRRYTTLPDKSQSAQGRTTDRIPGREEIRRQAEQVTVGAASPLEQVRMLNAHFHRDFDYALVTGGPATLFSLRNFIVRDRRGHCEMFASAMAVMCRMLGIPARVVSGFYTTENNRYEKFYYVRQSHSHTWVEVWIDGYGWLTVDPTPPGALVGESDRWAWLSVISEYWDSWSVQWRRFVVDYSLSDQFFFVRKIMDWLHELGLIDRRGRFGPRAWTHWHLPNGAWDSGGGTGSLLSAFVVLAGLAGLAGLLYRFRHRLWRRGLLRRRVLSVCRVDFYAQALSGLAREGWRRVPDQTPAEFADQVARAAPDLANFVALTRTYYRVRFANGSPRDDERAMMLRFFTHLRNRRRMARQSSASPAQA